MGSRLQKAGLVLVVLALVGYLSWRAWQAGGWENLLQKLKETAPTPSPSATVTLSSVPSRAPVKTQTTLPSAPATVTPTVAVTGERSQVVAEMNARRTGAGAGTLSPNDILMREAQEHADDMARREYFDHTSPDGTTFQQRMQTSGYASGTVAENLGLASGGPVTAVVDLWMGSESHRTNMLNPAYRGTGVGVAHGTYRGSPSTFVVAIFGAAP